MPTRSWDLQGTRNLDHDTDLLFEIALADDGGLLRLSRLVRNPVKLDDSPAAELDSIQRRKDGRQIDAATTELDELEGIPCLGGIGADIVDVLKVKEEKPIVMLLDG